MINVVNKLCYEVFLKYYSFDNNIEWNFLTLLRTVEIVLNRKLKTSLKWTPPYSGHFRLDPWVSTIERFYCISPCYIFGISCIISGVARGKAIGQLPNDSKVIAQGFFWNATNCSMPKNLETHVCSKIEVLLLQHNVSCYDLIKWFRKMNLQSFQLNRWS